MYGKEKIVPWADGLKGKDLLFAHSLTLPIVEGLFYDFMNIKKGNQSPVGHRNQRALLVGDEPCGDLNFMATAACQIGLQTFFRYLSPELEKIISEIERHKPDLVISGFPEIGLSLAGDNRPPVINIVPGLEDPCRGLAGFFMIRESLGRIDNLSIFWATSNPQELENSPFISLLALLCSLGKKLEVTIPKGGLGFLGFSLVRNLTTSGISLKEGPPADIEKTELIFTSGGSILPSVSPGKMILSSHQIEGNLLPTQMAVLEAVLGKE